MALFFLTCFVSNARESFLTIDGLCALATRPSKIKLAKKGTNNRCFIMAIIDNFWLKLFLIEKSMFHHNYKGWIGRKSSLCECN